MITTSNSNSYNGWKNYETWNVVLWINNREDLYVSARDFMARYKGRRPYKDWILYMWSGDRVLPYCTPDGVMYYDSALSYRELNSMMRELIK